MNVALLLTALALGQTYFYEEELYITVRDRSELVETATGTFNMQVDLTESMSYIQIPGNRTTFMTKFGASIHVDAPNLSFDFVWDPFEVRSLFQNLDPTTEIVSLASWRPYVDGHGAFEIGEDSGSISSMDLFRDHVGSRKFPGHTPTGAGMKIDMSATPDDLTATWLLIEGYTAPGPLGGYSNRVVSVQVGAPDKSWRYVISGQGSNALKTFFDFDPVTGDYNDDGIVDAADLNLVLFDWGLDASADWINERPIIDAVGANELNGVLFNWNVSPTAPSASAAFTAVPEPDGRLLMAVVFLFAIAVACQLRRSSSDSM